MRLKDEASRLGSTGNEVDILQGKLKTFDEEINRNHEFITKLQADLADSQNAKRILQDKLERIEAQKEGEKELTVNQY